jgi:hypothetical protein
MYRSGAFLGGIGAALLVFATWSAFEARAPIDASIEDGVEGGSRDLLANRAWVERMPRSKKDLVTWFVPLELRGKRFGVAQRASHYAFAGERFVYTRDGDHLVLTFQQTERKAKITAKAYECAGKAPKPFDLCLDLRSGKEEATFYSKWSWKVPGKGEGELPAFDLEPLPLAEEGSAHDRVGAPLGVDSGLRILLDPGPR